jgi:hypothetical protein
VQTVLDDLASRTDALGAAAIDALLRGEPSRALDRAEARTLDEAAAAVAFRCTYDHFAPRVDPTTWPDASLVRRFAFILGRVPGLTRRLADGRVHQVTPAQELYDVLTRVIVHLSRKGALTDTEVRQIAPDADPSWIQAQLDYSKAEELFRELVPSDTPPTLSDVLAFLDRPSLARIRSVDELFDAVRIILEERVAARVGDRLDLVLEGPRPRESALQAYVALELEHGLELIDPELAKAVREPKESRGNRPDFVVIAPGTNDGSRVFEVPVEVKWSHDPRCASDLVGALGRRYLADQRRTHGLYVVGFTGLERNTRMDELRTALGRERDQFHEERPDIRIEIVLLDLRRGSPTRTARLTKDRSSKTAAPRKAPRRARARPRRQS